MTACYLLWSLTVAFDSFDLRTPISICQLNLVLVFIKSKHAFCLQLCCDRIARDTVKRDLLLSIVI